MLHRAPRIAQADHGVTRERDAAAHPDACERLSILLIDLACCNGPAAIFRQLVQEVAGWPEGPFSLCLFSIEQLILETKQLNVQHLAGWQVGCGQLGQQDAEVAVHLLQFLCQLLHQELEAVPPHLPQPSTMPCQLQYLSQPVSLTASNTMQASQKEISDVFLQLL